MDEITRIETGQRRGRAAATNLTPRFEPETRVAVHDGWDLEEDLPPLRTEVRDEAPRSAITRNSSPDVPFDRSLNPYRGCEHGCIYCFARPTHAYLGMSPGLDFETRLIARPGIAKVLDKELRRASYKPRTLAIGTNTDPYQPIELRHGVMRSVLEVLRDFRHPVGIVTKGTLIERDIDILSEMAAEGLAHVGVSLTTLDAGLSRAMEPRAPAPARRLRVIERLSAAGIPVRAMLAPVIPALTDPEVEAMLEAASGAGAQAASWIMLRLPGEVAPLFHDWLEERFPDRAGRIRRRLREMHGGQEYDARFGHRMRGEGPYAAIIERRFRVAVARLGLDGDLPPLRSDLFRVPLGTPEQPSLF